MRDDDCDGATDEMGVCPTAPPVVTCPGDVSADVLDTIALLDRGALFASRLCDLHHGIDEQPQSCFCRHPASTGMRRGQQSALLELRQDRPDRSGRQVHPTLARQRFRSHWRAAVEIAFDHEPENLAGAVG